MTEVVSKAQFQQWRNSIDSGGVEAVQQVYNSLYEQGYNYAGWASGVAGGDTVSGWAALRFLDGSVSVRQTPSTSIP